MAPTSPPMDFTDPEIQNFISLNDTYVTADEAALVTAGIVPAAARFKVDGARGSSSNKAITVRQALLRAAGSNNGPTLISVTHWHDFGYSSDAEISRGAESIANAIDQYGEPHDATFEAMSVWQWLQDRNLLDPDYVLPSHSSSSFSELDLPDELFPEQVPAFKSSKQMLDLTQQVAKLTERLQEAEKKIAALKEMTPHFRHMTPALKLVAEVQEQHWGDSWAESITPKKEVIVQGLVDDHGLSNIKATAIDYVASPIDRATGERHQ